jgi:hypothetical protein
MAFKNIQLLDLANFSSNIYFYYSYSSKKSIEGHERAFRGHESAFRGRDSAFRGREKVFKPVRAHVKA